MKILFQGDSITDADRYKPDPAHLGKGYPCLVASKLGLDYPERYEFINRGVSGNRIVDVYSRINLDIIQLQPDMMSLLIGVNDVWHKFIPEGDNSICEEKFEKLYCILIEEIKAALPDIKLLILEPFVLKGCATEEHWEYFETEVAKRAAVAKRVAEKYDIPFLPLQDKFNKLTETAPASYWLKDGVHPTCAGHEFLAREWIKVAAENNLI